MLRPKDVTDQLGISAATLRLWSNNFSDVLSPSAQKATTETGTAAQRRYTPEDLAYFRRAKEILGQGLTYDQTLERLRAEPIEISPEEIQSGSIAGEPSITGLSIATETHPIIRAFEEALRAKDQVIESKDQTIAALEARIEDLVNRPPLEEHSVALLPAPIIKPTFRWSWLNKLLTVEGKDVG